MNVLRYIKHNEVYVNSMEHHIDVKEQGYGNSSANTVES